MLPDEDAAEFQALEAALLDELAPVGPLQTVLARADRMETELFAERGWDNRGVRVALIRDGNGTRSFQTLLRYRGAAMAEFWRALRTLKALQAEQAARSMATAAPRPRTGRWVSRTEPERLMAYVLPEPAMAGGALHEPPAPPPRRPEPNEPKTGPESSPEHRLAYLLSDPDPIAKTVMASFADLVHHAPLRHAGRIRDLARPSYRALSVPLAAA